MGASLKSSRSTAHVGIEVPAVAAKLLTVEDVANRCQVSCYTVRSWARQGMIPVNRLGRLLRFEPEDVTEFIRMRRSGR